MKYKIKIGMGLLIFPICLYGNSLSQADSFLMDSFVVVRPIPIHRVLEAPRDPIYEEIRRAILGVEWDKGIVGHPFNFVRIMNASNFLILLCNRKETNVFEELEAMDLFLDKFISMPYISPKSESNSIMKKNSLKHCHEMQKLAEDVKNGTVQFEEFHEKLHIWFLKYRSF